jgi:hypothetical protein
MQRSHGQKWRNRRRASSVSSTTIDQVRPHPRHRTEHAAMAAIPSADLPGGWLRLQNACRSR